MGGRVPQLEEFHVFLHQLFCFKFYTISVLAAYFEDMKKNYLYV